MHTPLPRRLVLASCLLSSLAFAQDASTDPFARYVVRPAGADRSSIRCIASRAFICM